MFIEENSLHTIYARLTSYGRKQISRGKLDFSTFSVGDSEADYSLAEYAILRPEDVPAGIKHYILDSEEDRILRKPLQALKEAKFVAVNEAKERGFFLFSDAWQLRDEFYYSKQEGFAIICSGTTISGGTYSNTVLLDKNINMEVGDLLMLSLNTLPLSGATQTSGYAQASGGTEITNRSYLFYKIQGITGSTVELDRQLPIGRLCDSYYQIYPSTFSYYDKSPNIYWDKSSNNYEDTCPDAEDVEVWNLNICHPQSALGLSGGTWEQYTGYGSSRFLNWINYLGYDKNTRLGIVHYSNNAINNFYGEGFEKGTAYIELPTLFHPLKPTIGIRLYCSGDAKELKEGDFILPYYDLAVQISGDTTDPVVGKCLPNQKVFVIDDQEMLAAMSYKSDRNMVLPDFNGALIYNESLSAILEQGEEADLWVTYGFSSSTYLSPIPYQIPKKYSFFTQEGCIQTAKASLQISFDASLFQHIGRLPEKPYEFDRMYALVQKTSVGEYPSADSWRLIELMSNISGITQSELDVLHIIGGIDYDSAQLYSLGDYIDLPLNGEGDRLQFGDEFFLFGNVGADIKAEIYQSSFYLPLDFDSFAYSQNPTWSDDLGYVDVTEVAIYDSSSKPVVWAKMPRPIRKPCGQNRTLIVNIDF